VAGPGKCPLLHLILEVAKDVAAVLRWAALTVGLYPIVTLQYS
jgi:hypothetical protein